jgi:hypothetical protein
MAGRPCYTSTFVLTTDDKLPMLRKIKRAASCHTSQRFCSTFNFAQPHQSPTTTRLYRLLKNLHILRQLTHQFLRPCKPNEQKVF